MLLHNIFHLIYVSQTPEKKEGWGIEVTAPRDIHIPTTQALVPDYFIYSFKPIGHEESSSDDLRQTTPQSPLDHRGFSGLDEMESTHQHPDDDHDAHVLDVLW